MISAILFDLDNTLVNRQRAFRNFTERFIDKYLILSSPTERESAIHYIRESDRDGYRSRQEFYHELLERFTWKKETNLDELLDFWFSEFYKCTTLMDGAIEVIQALKSKGKKLGLITNGSIHTQNAKIDYVGIRKYFDTIVVSDEVNVKKPDPRIFEIALERLDIEAKHAVYVGDNPENDVIGAEDAGLTAIWLQGFREWEDIRRKPGRVIHELKELVGMILEAGNQSK